MNMNTLPTAKLKPTALRGYIIKKPPLQPALLDKIEKLIALDNEDRTFLIEILTQSSYERAKPYLQDLVTKDPKKVFQFVWWYAQDHCADWVSVVKELLPTITDEKNL